MNKKFKITVSLIAVLTLVFGLNTFVFAGDNYTILSKGRFVDRKGTETTSDDTVYFDASDLTTLKDMVETGKTKISSSLNAYPNTNVQSLDTFDNLSTAIDNLTSVPDIYYYDKATEGDSCARYMYENGSYYPCDQNGKKTSTTALSGTITVVTKDDTTEPADGEIQLVKYEQTDAANLSAGFAGYADKSFILGSGSDNISYRNQGLQEIFLSFSGQSLICPYNSVSWSIDSGDGLNTWLTKDGLVCTITNPELFTQLDLSYTASLGGKIDGVWKESNYKSITFTLTGESGIEYYSGSEKTISLANIAEPVNLHVTWKAKIANSAYDGDFKISSVSVVIK